MPWKTGLLRLLLCPVIIDIKSLGVMPLSDHIYEAQGYRKELLAFIGSSLNVTYCRKFNRTQQFHGSSPWPSPLTLVSRSYLLFAA